MESQQFTTVKLTTQGNAKGKLVFHWAALLVIHSYNTWCMGPCAITVSTCFQIRIDVPHFTMHQESFSVASTAMSSRTLWKPGRVSVVHKSSYAIGLHRCKPGPRDLKATFSMFLITCSSPNAINRNKIEVKIDVKRIDRFWREICGLA